MRDPRFGFELAKFFRKQRLDFPLGQAQVQRLGDELFHRRLDLPPPRLQPQRGRLVRDIGAEPAARLAIIRTDGWKAYEKLDEMGYVHQVVNHSKEFVTKEGWTTNRVESMWRPIEDPFREIKIRSVCIDCQKKFEEAYEQTKETEEDDEEARKEKLEGERSSTAESERIGGLCSLRRHETTFGNKIYEFLWR